MDLTSLKNIKRILNGKYPAKKLGQNFLIDETTIKDLVEVAEVNRNDNVLEVGPGLGAITEELSKTAQKIIAIEKDIELVNHLQNLSLENVELINDDFLKIDLNSLKLNNYKAIANLPFNVATAIIRKILTEGNPNSIAVILQKEVAERIEAEGEKENFLSITTKIQGDPKIHKIVPRNCFWPMPRVDGAILKITPRKQNENVLFYNHFFSVAEAGFRHPRKQLKNNLSSLKITKKQAKDLLVSLNLNPKIRAEDLSVSDWKNITKKYLTLKKKGNKIS